MGRSKFLILTALRLETRAVARALALRTNAGGLTAQGLFNGVGIDLATVGLRAVRLPAAVPPDVKCIVIAGLGGGLDPSLKVGNVVVAGSEGVGTIHTSDRPVVTPEDKAAAYRATGARVVDMETAFVRRWVASARVPVVAVRVVSDTADQAIDPAVLALVDEVGRPRPAMVVGYLLRNPWRIRHLLQLGAASKFAAQRLGDAVRQWVIAQASVE